MAIVNVTPDSFYAPSRTMDEASLINRVRQVVDEGADIIDIGAYSTRPGAGEVSAEEEIERLRFALPVVRDIAPDTPLSVDTFRADVARMAVSDLGCDIVNDISGGNLDDEMFRTVAELKVPYVLTHGRGTPATMHQHAVYDNVVCDVIRELAAKLSTLEELGVADILVDPGFGFAKTLEQNYEILARLDEFKCLHRPILVGVSRKSMVSKLNGMMPNLIGETTTALHAYCLDRGASIIRTHDVAAARQCVNVYQHLISFSTHQGPSPTL